VADVLARPVDHLAPRGTSQPLEDVTLGPGGNGLNTAIALARLGVSVRVAAAVGNDRFGHLIRDRLRAEGIESEGLVTLPDAKTSTSIVLVEATGERRFLHLRGVSAFFSGQNLNWEEVKGCRIFHYASAFAIPAFDETSLAPALKRAHELGCVTSMNICWDVRGRWLRTIQPALAHTDVIFPNVDEGRELTGESEPPMIAARLREWGVKTVVIKLGAAGCYVESPQGSFLWPVIALPRDFWAPFVETRRWSTPRAMLTPPGHWPASAWAQPIPHLRWRNWKSSCANIPLPHAETRGAAWDG